MSDDREERSPELLLVAYYFARYDSKRGQSDAKVPPEIRSLGIRNKTDAYRLFYNRVGGISRSAEKFVGIFRKEVDGLASQMRKRKQFRESRLRAFGAYLTATDQELWERVMVLIDPSLPMLQNNTPLADTATRPTSLHIAASTNVSESAEAMSRREPKRVLRPVLERPGQGAFRSVLLVRNGGACQVTGCDVVEALEAAHISPFAKDCDDDPENGLLLRADMHTLFDRNLIGIDPTTMTIQLHPKLRDHYSELEGTLLTCPGKKMPSVQNLRERFECFQIRCQQADEQ